MQSQPTTLLCRYGYDPLDRLTSHTLTQTPERQRFYCKSRLTTEIQGAIKHSIVQHGDLLLAQRHVEDEALDTTLLVTDQQRSVLHIFKADHSPKPIAYSPYGHHSAKNGLLSLLGFNGERPDPVTGHYLLGNGYRAFNPVLMRFNSPDSWSPFGNGGLNAYAYCLGDPVNKTDPMGHVIRLVGKLVSNEIDTLLAVKPSASVKNSMKSVKHSKKSYTPSPREVEKERVDFNKIVEKNQSDLSGKKKLDILTKDEANRHLLYEYVTAESPALTNPSYHSKIDEIAKNGINIEHINPLTQRKIPNLKEKAPIIQNEAMKLMSEASSIRKDPFKQQ
jgi:RHS repeat-associated protein